jgi:hypothetical protein
MTKKIANYEAPRLTVVEFRTERGYAGSFNAVQTINMFADRESQRVILMEGDHNFVGGYMDGEREDNSDPIGNWTLTDGTSHF